MPASNVTGNHAGITGLQAAVDAPAKVRGVQLMNISLRMLHTTKQAAWQRPLVSSLQRLFAGNASGPVVLQCHRKAAGQGMFSLLVATQHAFRHIPAGTEWLMGRLCSAEHQEHPARVLRQL